MAIYLDFSGTIFAAIHVDLKGGNEPTKEYIRHIVINNIKNYNRMFGKEYGMMTICYDSKSWRDDQYEFYKYERRMGRKEDDNDWSKIFEYITEIQEEIKCNLPFPVLQAYGAEADDIIGSLVRNNKEHSLIISNDKDLAALLKYDWVERYRPCVKGKEKEVIDDFKRFEFDLILSGDKADGIPNVKSPDDFFVTQFKDRESGKKPIRAQPVTVKFKNECWEEFLKGEEHLERYLGPILYNNFLRNRLLICLDKIPEHVEYEIRKAVKTADKPCSIMETLTYLTKNKMSALAREINDFTPCKEPNKPVSVFDL